MEEFVREKIKDKPINKRKIVIRLLVAAACGVVFAITACLVAAFLWPKLKPLESDDALVKETETETETEVPSESTEAETESETEIQVDYELTVDDYQHIQNELYAIGNSANKSK